MAETAIVAHQIPGRVRLRIPARRGDTDYFAQLSDACSHLDTVEKVKANPSTGSLVVEFNDAAASLLEQIRHVGLIIEHAPTEDTDRRMIATEAGHAFPLNLVTGREINPMFMIGSLLAMLGIVQAARGKIMAPSLTLFWYAMDAYRQSRKQS